MEGNDQRGDDVATATRTLKQKAYHGVREFFAIAGVVLALFAVYKSVILAQHHIDGMSHGLARVVQA